MMGTVQDSLKTELLDILRRNIMVETVSKWSHSVLLVTFLVMTYAVVITLR